MPRDLGLEMGCGCVSPTCQPRFFRAAKVNEQRGGNHERNYLVYIMLGIYIVYCFYWGLRGYFTEKTSSGYAIAGRSIPFFAFLLASTAASFSGWTFVSHPGAIYLSGLAYAFASFYVLTIPITAPFSASVPG